MDPFSASFYSLIQNNVSGNFGLNFVTGEQNSKDLLEHVRGVPSVKEASAPVEILKAIV